MFWYIILFLILAILEISFYTIITFFILLFLNYVFKLYLPLVKILIISIIIGNIYSICSIFKKKYSNNENIYLLIFINEMMFKVFALIIFLFFLFIIILFFY
jgi:hypothetical protein